VRGGRQSRVSQTQTVNWDDFLWRFLNLYTHPPCTDWWVYKPKPVSECKHSGTGKQEDKILFYCKFLFQNFTLTWTYCLGGIRGKSTFSFVKIKSTKKAKREIIDGKLRKVDHDTFSVQVSEEGETAPDSSDTTLNTAEKITGTPPTYPGTQSSDNRICNTHLL
jgi:hypothetical protein